MALLHLDWARVSPVADMPKLLPPMTPWTWVEIFPGSMMGSTRALTSCLLLKRRTAKVLSSDLEPAEAAPKSVTSEAAAANFMTAVDLGDEM